MSTTIKTAIAAPLTLALASLCTLVLQGSAGCCGPAGSLDEQLQVEVVAPAELESSETHIERACGMQVRAVDERGEAIELQEEERDDGCVYRGQADPNRVYTIEIEHPEHGRLDQEGAYSHTAACGQEADPEATDMMLDFTLQPRLELAASPHQLENTVRR